MHEVRIKGGKKQERHLCERCAREAGVSPVAKTPPFAQLLTQIIATPGMQDAAEFGASGGADAGGGDAVSGVGAAEAGKAAQLTICPNCGLPFSQFRATGLLGCPECYRSFEALLSPLLARAHEGGTHHVGRTPQGVGQPLDDALAVKGDAKPGASTSEEREANEQVRKGREATLRRQLAEAVAAEQYEKAAKLRDQLASVQATKQAGDGSADARTAKVARKSGRSAARDASDGDSAASAQDSGEPV